MQTSGTETTAAISEPGIMSRICSFVEANSLRVEQPQLADQIPSGVGAVDSKDLARVIDFIESEYGMYVSKYEISEENFGSLRAIAHFVASNRPFAVG